MLLQLSKSNESQSVNSSQLKCDFIDVEELYNYHLKKIKLPKISLKSPQKEAFIYDHILLNKYFCFLMAQSNH